MRYKSVDHSTKYESVMFCMERNDCTVFAVENAFGVPYEQAYRVLQVLGRKRNTGFYIAKLHRKAVLNERVMMDVTKKYRLKSLQWFLDQQFKGSYILSFHEHTIAVVNGTYYDTRERREKMILIKRAWKIVRRRQTISELAKELAELSEANHAYSGSF